MLSQRQVDNSRLVQEEVSGGVWGLTLSATFLKSRATTTSAKLNVSSTRYVHVFRVFSRGDRESNMLAASVPCRQSRLVSLGSLPGQNYLRRRKRESKLIL